MGAAISAGIAGRRAGVVRWVIWSTWTGLGGRGAAGNCGFCACVGLCCRGPRRGSEAQSRHPMDCADRLRAGCCLRLRWVQPRLSPRRSGAACGTACCGRGPLHPYRQDRPDRHQRRCGCWSTGRCNCKRCKAPRRVVAQAVKFPRMKRSILVGLVTSVGVWAQQISIGSVSQKGPCIVAGVIGNVTINCPGIDPKVMRVLNEHFEAELKERDLRIDQIARGSQ